ncbi:MAG: hypothetical protein VKJ44_02570 [Synechococcus sp.]|nr:hypothetical protein [Synechococcus sp.]
MIHTHNPEFGQMLTGLVVLDAAATGDLLALGRVECVDVGEGAAGHLAQPVAAALHPQPRLRLPEAWDGMHARVASPASSLARPLETVSNRTALACPCSQVREDD